MNDLEFSEEEAKVISSEIDIARDGLLTGEEIRTASPRRIASKLRATPQHLAELKALEIALEYEQAKIAEVERVKLRIRGSKQDDVISSTSPSSSKASTLTKSPKRGDGKSGLKRGSIYSTQSKNDVSIMEQASIMGWRID